jgi:N6-L-threonylcarbamoyladenine synthase
MIATLGAHVIAGGATPSALTVATDPGLSVQVSNY